MCIKIVENVLSGTKAGFKATRNLVFNQKAERSTMNRQKSRGLVENVLSGMKAGFKATRNLVFNQKAERSTMNRQKSRGLVENVLSGMKAGFKSILNIFKHPKRESRMFNQKSSSTLSTTLLALILGASVFMAGQVWAAEMVKDPSTGKMIKAPQYGGQIVFASTADEPPHTDTWFSLLSYYAINLVLEKLGIVDWSYPRDKWGFSGWNTPLEVVKPHLAESYEIPDPLTFIFKIRKGVYWQNKPPMNGRELTADDVAFSFHRMTGLGSGFTEPSPIARTLTRTPFESITATDKWTVVMKLKKIDWVAFDYIYHMTAEGGWIYPPEVIKEHGHMQDWRTAVGTGPYMLTDWVEGSAITYTKNPDYWAYDEKFPENRLPYADEVKMLFMPDPSTRLAALRTGKIVLLRDITSVDQAKSLQRTNPELMVKTGIYFRSTSSNAMDVRKPPFDDIRVRQAMQLAIDIETINQGLYNGLAEATPMGLFGTGVLGFYVPFEEWPDEVKANYGYDPERAEKLLDEAGYPRGPDGTRFKTTLMYVDGWGDADLEYQQVAKDYWSQIGVDVEFELTDVAAMLAHVNAHTYEGMVWTDRGSEPSAALMFIRVKAYSNELWNYSGLQDPEYDAIVEAAENASSYEEMVRYVKEADMYYIKLHTSVWGPRPPVWHFWQPWLGGYNGEKQLGAAMNHPILARTWIDQDMKEAMGH